MLDPRTAARSASSTVEATNTTLAQDGTGVTLISKSFNIASGWKFYPVQEEHPVLEAGQRLVRVSAPADAITLNGSLVWEEIGRPAA